MSKKVLLTTAAIAVMANAQPVFAQAADGDNTATEKKSIQSTIVVTGRKKAETLLEAPISVSAFNAEMLEAAGAISAKDIADLTPGLQIEGDLGRESERPVIRGVANIQATVSQPVGLYIDGVFVRSGLISSMLDNVERVEVLKGPQGALYGRSTYGGVINYLTKKPSEEFEGNFSATYAQHDQVELGGNISGQILPGVNGLIGGRYYTYGGEYDNVNDNTRGARDVGEENTTAYYGALNFVPESMPKFEANIRGYYSNDEDGQFAGHLYGTPFNNSVPAGGNACPNVIRSYFCGTVSTPDELDIATAVNQGDVLNVTGPAGPAVAAWDFRAGSERETARIWGDVSYDLTDDITVLYQGGYTKESSHTILNQSYSPVVVGNSFGSFYSDWVTDDRNKTEYMSHEVRFNGSIGDKIEWLGGVFYYDEEDENTDRSILEADLGFGGLNKLNEKSIFGSIEFKPIDALSIGLEGRAYESERDTTLVAGGNAVGDTLSKTEDGFTYRVTGDYTLPNGGLLYASVSTGNKAGGFNSAVDPNDPNEAPFLEYDEELATQYEIGFKTDYADGRGNFTAAIFRTELTDQQLSQVVIFNEGTPQQTQETVVLNVGETEINGFELDTTFAVTDNLTIGASWATADSEIKEGTDDAQRTTIDDIDDGIVGPGTGSLAGYKVPRVSKNSGAVNASYTFGDVGGWENTIRMDGIYSSSRYAQVHNLQETGDRFKLNLRYTLGHDDSGTQLVFWGKNVLDDDTASNVFRYVDPGNFRFFGRAHVVFMPRGRQVGVTLKKSF
ncbi:TonB-dependent receptor [Hirschia litorea]|uniref:TonB-dependent receptor n=1 Tax=Hirschia litorea TaxID=1199156 RepID=A0ABW2IGS6_9PROT